MNCIRPIHALVLMTYCKMSQWGKLGAQDPLHYCCNFLWVYNDFQVNKFCFSLNRNLLFLCHWEFVLEFYICCFYLASAKWKTSFSFHRNVSNCNTTSWACFYSTSVHVNRNQLRTWWHINFSVSESLPMMSQRYGCSAWSHWASCFALCQGIQAPGGTFLRGMLETTRTQNKLVCWSQIPF
jgi:hypothetical protein